MKNFPSNIICLFCNQGIDDLYNITEGICSYSCKSCNTTFLYAHSDLYANSGIYHSNTKIFHNDYLISIQISYFSLGVISYITHKDIPNTISSIELYEEDCINFLSSGFSQIKLRFQNMLNFL